VRRWASWVQDESFCASLAIAIDPFSVPIMQKLDLRGPAWRAQARATDLLPGAMTAGVVVRIVDGDSGARVAIEGDVRDGSHARALVAR